MPAREAAALLDAIDEFRHAYERDPAYESILKDLDGLATSVIDLGDPSGRDPQESPGRRDAALVSERAGERQEQRRAPLEERRGDDRDPPRTFREAGDRAREHFRGGDIETSDDARAAAGTASGRAAA